ncbi:MAG: NADH-quinone oxidoreductase subunit J [Rhodobacteraceae bacterium]|nr:MAG: NADH-quinone oxidoreductase subunit J [Paracoccaceae bacterium]
MQASEMAFYFFSVVIVVSAILVVISRNPVHSVLWLIVTFFGSSGLFILLGAEFLALILMIVYVGAVAVLFMFVVMMLNINFDQLRSGFTRYLPVGLLIGLILFVELSLVFSDWVPANSYDYKIQNSTIGDIENTKQLGLVLYTDFVLYFQLAGIILLIAMIGAIVLTHQRKRNIKRQDILAQIYRDPEKAIELKDIKPGQGL